MAIYVSDGYIQELMHDNDNRIMIEICPNDRDPSSEHFCDEISEAIQFLNRYAQKENMEWEDNLTGYPHLIGRNHSANIKFKKPIRQEISNWELKSDMEYFRRLIVNGLKPIDIPEYVAEFIL